MEPKFHEMVAELRRDASCNEPEKDPRLAKKRKKKQKKRRRKERSVVAQMKPTMERSAKTVKTAKKKTY